MDNLLVVVQHRTVAKTLDGHLHIRLTSTHPYLAREDVLDGHCTLSVVEGDVQRLVTGLRRLHRQQPAALLVGFGLDALV